MVWRAAHAVASDGGAVMNAVAHANEAAWRVADNGVQLLGGAGFIQDYPAEKWMRDTKALAHFGPPTELVTLLRAGGLVNHRFVDDAPSLAVQPFFT
jgi:alkylation response protein AidB-like acyl-CoA dehydrogenase